MSAPAETLYVVAVVSNPERYASRYRLAQSFIARMEATPGVKLVVVEHQTGDRPHMVTDAMNPWHLQLRGDEKQTLWIKEAMVNAGIRHLTKLVPGWRCVLWCDADVEFTRPGWVAEVMAEFDHSKVLQPWSDAVDLGPQHEVLATYKSMLSCYRKGIPSIDKGEKVGYGAYWHTGYAWGIRRDAWDALGGLLDWCIMGSGDHHMGWAMIGQVHKTVPGNVTAGYRALLFAWQARAERAIEGQLGYVNGAILHHWHGKKVQRGYQSRWAYLLNNKYDPITDIIYDDAGIPKLAGNKPKLQHDLRHYLQSRNEDSIDLE